MASKGWHPGLGRAPHTRPLAKGEIFESQLAQAENIIRRAEWQSLMIRKRGYSLHNQLMDYIEIVSKEIARQQYLTHKKMQKLLARETEWILVHRYIKGDSIFRNIAGARTREDAYQYLVNEWMSRGFNLYVYDGKEEIPRWLKSRFGTIGYRLENEVETVLYDELYNAFVEAWNGVKLDAFPEEYRAQIIAVIAHLRETRAFRRGEPTGSGANFTGPPNALGWKLIVDFNRVFGDFNDLWRGYHYGALTATGGRVTLPYDNEPLKNPGRGGTVGYLIRYNYWKALWAGKNEARFYFAYSGKSRIGSARNKMKIRRRQLENIGKKAMKEGRYSKKRGYDLTVEEQESARGYLQDYVDLEDAIKKEDRTRMPYSIPIPPNARRDTIAARLAAWGKNKAPFWLYLEFGQLTSNPRVPPRGVYYRFYAKAIRAIKILVDRAMREMFPTKSPTLTGGYIVPINTPESRIKTPKLRKSGDWKLASTPSALIESKREQAVAQIYRTAQEASRVAAEYTINSPHLLSTVHMPMSKTQADRLPRTGLPKAQTVPTITGQFKQRSNSFMQDASTGRMMGSRPSVHTSPLPSYRGGSGSAPTPRSSSANSLSAALERTQLLNKSTNRYKQASEYRKQKAWKHYYHQSGGDVAKTMIEYSKYLDRVRKRRAKKFKS